MTSGERPLRLLGAVLAGGESRRFGRDKTAEPVGGVSMIERAVATLEEVCDEVVVVSSRPATPTGRWRIVPDLRPGEGPLAGLEAALAEAAGRGYDGTLVLAADLPLVDGTTLDRVVEALGEDDAAAAATPLGGSVGDGEAGTRGEDSVEVGEGSVATGGPARPFRSLRVQPLCAVYRVACAGPAGRLLDEGRRDAGALLEAMGGSTVEVDPDVLVNVNTPEALARVEGMGHRHAGSGAGGPGPEEDDR